MPNPYQPPKTEPKPPGTLGLRYTDLPTVCPSCNRSLGPIQPERKWQRKAVVLFIAGWLASIVSACVLFAVVLDGANRMNGAGFAVMLFLPSLPCLGIGLIAANMRKVVSLKCFHCNWSERYLMEKG